MSRPVICQVCSRALDNYVNDDGASFVHPLHVVTDHDPVPVAAPPGWRGKCDFCGELPPEYGLPAQDFRLASPGLLDQMSRGDWAACVECAELINRNRWNALEQRAAEAMSRTHGIPEQGPHRFYLHDMYRRLRKAVSGALHKIGDDE